MKGNVGVREKEITFKEMQEQIVFSHSKTQGIKDYQGSRGEFK